MGDQPPAPHHECRFACDRNAQKEGVVSDRKPYFYKEGFAMHFMKVAVAISAVMVAAVLGYSFWPVGQKARAVNHVESAEAAPLAMVVLPDNLSQSAQIGKLGFDAKCATCHGVNAAGKDGLAPPLIHKIYEPSHHADESFQRAVALGVQAHHWRFGNMPVIEGLTRGDVTMIIAFIRELQRANGIN
jgi:mono/diheme cytochrome c family protein